jgi:hypothetical protein
VSGTEHNPALPAPPPPIRRGHPAVQPEVAEPTPLEVAAARSLADGAGRQLQQARAFQQLPAPTRVRILDELDAITRQLGGQPDGAVASSLGTPLEFRRVRPGFDSAQPAQDGATESGATQAPAADGSQQAGDATPKTTRAPATETIARRAGALSDEIDFPDFIAGLVHNTFDAIVDASIRQMEAFADLVSSVAKTAEDFARDNVTANHARDWLVQQYPNDLQLDLTNGPKVVPKPKPASSPDGGDGADQQPNSPDWLADYGLEGQELTEDLIEQQLVPVARGRVGQNRQQMLATMVLLGMNRVIVRDGSITARLRFRAVAADHAKVDYAVSDDPSGSTDWGARASSAYAVPTTKVSTVGVNVQTDSNLNAELFGEVKINFVSETLPLDRFVDDARRTLLERHARARSTQNPAAGTPQPAPPPGTAAPVPTPVGTTPGPQTAPRAR